MAAWYWKNGKGELFEDEEVCPSGYFKRRKDSLAKPVDVEAVVETVKSEIKTAKPKTTLKLKKSKKAD